MGKVLLFSMTAAFYPTLLAATTVMLVLPRPKPLLLGYYCGAMMTSLTIGLVIVFTLDDGNSAATKSTQHTVNPVIDIVFGALILILVAVAAREADARRARKERKRAAQADKGPPRWRQALSNGTPRTTFVIGALLTLPGASYLAALTATAKQDLSTVETALTVLMINLIMLVLLEVPLVGYFISPDWTGRTVARFTAWLSREGARVVAYVAIGIGLALIVKGIGGLLLA